MGEDVTNSAEVSILSPSYFCDEKEILDAKNNLSKLGFTSVLDYTSRNKLFDKWAGTLDERLDSFHEAWNSNSNPIICCKGGSGLSHFLPRINKDLLKERKMFVGYSDITFLLNFISQKLNIITVHGPNALKELDEESISSLVDAMSMRDYSVKFSRKKFLNSFSGKIEGKTIGGNLDRLVESLQWVDLDFRGKVVFLEEIGETEHRIFNLLTSLKNYPLFQPSAIVFGDLSVENNALMKKMIKYVFPEIPIIFGMPFGNSLPNISVPIGADCVIDSEESILHFNFPKSEKYYSADLGEDNCGKNIYSGRIRGRNFSFNKMKSIESMLKKYRAKNFVTSEKFVISGDREKKINYLTSPIRFEGEKYVIAEFGDSESSRSVFLRNQGNRWIVDDSIKTFGLNNPKIFRVLDKWVLVGHKMGNVEIYSGDNLRGLVKKTFFGPSVGDFAFSDKGSKFGVFVRHERNIKYFEISSIDEISMENISNAISVLSFAEGEWGNVVQAMRLKNGKTGVLGYLARKFEGSGNYFYYPFVFCFDSKTFETSSIRIILKRGELPDTECSSSEYYNVVLPGGMVRRGDDFNMYASVGNYEGCKISLKNPFHYYEKNF
jgi:muramoyltetrapeptide carboxypeptidase